MKKIKVVWCVISIIIMTLIFFFSHQSADVSSDTSGRFAKILANFLALIFKGELYERILWVAQWIVRKSAHLVLYAMLGICVYNTFNISGKLKRLLISMAICVLYAISDEIHQSFVPGRACRLSDVLIDGIGSISGIAFIKLKVLKRIFKKTDREEDIYGN